MRHMTSGRQFSRTTPHRRAMFRNMAANLFKYERIKTTDPKAKELRSVVEKLITLGKAGDLHSRRMARTFIQDREVLSKLFGEIKDRFSKRKGGYTRILKLHNRIGDAAPMVLIELIPSEKAKAKKEDAKDKKKGKETKEVSKPTKDAKPAKEKKETTKEEKTDPGV
jgi:large subunit ribosomal protein L17